MVSMSFCLVFLPGQLRGENAVGIDVLGTIHIRETLIILPLLIMVYMATKNNVFIYLVGTLYLIVSAKLMWDVIY